MANTEKQIIDAIEALGLFAKVRYIIAESDMQDIPTVLPIFVLTDAGRDYTFAQAFCGNLLTSNGFEAVILSPTASECRSLFASCVDAIKDIATATSATDSYDDELGAYVTEINLISN